MNELTDKICPRTALPARLATLPRPLVFTNGVFDAADITFTAVTGNTVEAIVVFLDTGTPANDLLICYIDSASSGLPVTPNGGDVNVVWSGSGICSL